MIESSRLKDLLSKKEYQRFEKILICLATNNAIPKHIKDIKSLAISFGLREASKWNISQILSDSKSLAVRIDSGWELTQEGRKYVAEIAGPYASSPIAKIASNLRQFLPNITDENTKKFVEEAIECYEATHYRAAVVLSWIGAVSILYTYVLNNYLFEFNTEAAKRDTKWKNAKNSDDLSKMKESDFLNVIEKISIIGKNVKQELEECLRLRNGCGHPNSLKIAESRVASHIEILILNVFEKYS